MSRAICLWMIFFTIPAWAMPVKTQLLRTRAFLKEGDNKLLEAMDLKAKTLHFAKDDHDQCGINLVRRARTLSYSCTLPIPTKARLSSLQSQITGASTEVMFGGTKRVVTAVVAADARSVTFTTSFDATGIDFEVFKFNDDFFKVYDKVAQLIIAEAQSRQPIRIEVAEAP